MTCPALPSFNCKARSFPANVVIFGSRRAYSALPEAHQQRLRDRDSYFGDVLAAPFGGAGDDHRRLRAVIGHATSFWTWRSLCIDHGLADTEAVDAMTGMVLALTRAGQPARGR